MATAIRTRPVINDYPTSDGRPMAETDWHLRLMIDLIQTLEFWAAGEPNTYVSGNLLLFYEEGNKRRHVSPDVFVVKGVPKRQRPNYLMWEEGKGPDVVFELTSSSTRSEDVKKKFALYRDVLKVKEYFLFDPRRDYLRPPMQGYRLLRGEYVPIKWVGDRLPSRVLGLHLERDNETLRLYDPATGRWLLTALERADEAGQLKRENEELRRRLAERNSH
jgi:Uma2 family endonuclease